MIIVILAAGRGKRLKNTIPKNFPYKTKALVPINNEPAIKRLTNQFLQINKFDILLVLGHQYESILKVFNDKKHYFVFNHEYEKDSNLRSLFLGFEKIITEKILNIDEGVLVIEADSLLSNDQIKFFLKHVNKLNSKKEFLNQICWTTKGYARSKDSGGFIDTFENISHKRFGEVKSIYIKNNPNSSKTMKMFGMTWFNSHAANDWYLKAKLSLKNKNKSNEFTGYFHEIIFENLNSYSNSYYDFGKKALSFNNFEEYLKCLHFN